MKEIDMIPYEEYFTKLERLYFEKDARMNIVAYMTNDNFFNKDVYDRVFNDYVIALQNYNNFIPIFEREVVIPICGPVRWKANFEQRVIYID